MKVQNILIFIVGLLIITNLYTCVKSNNKYNSQSKLISAYQDTFTRFKTEDGKNAAKRQVLEGSVEELLNIIEDKNNSLSKLIKSKAKSGVVIEQITSFDTITKVRIDTVNNKPSFSDTTKNNWINLVVSLRNDSLTKNIELKDSLTVSFKEIRNGFLKPKKNYVTVTNANPYVKINDIQSFQIPQKKSNSKLVLGLILGAVTGYLLFK